VLEVHRDMLTGQPAAEAPNPLQSTPPAVGATAVPTTGVSKLNIEDRIRHLLADIPIGAEPVAAMYVLLYNKAEGIAELAAAARGMLRFGEHDGPCTNHDDASGTEACVFHVEAFELRQVALGAALAKLDEASRG
jgi:hypothetical protein